MVRMAKRRSWAALPNLSKLYSLLEPYFKSSSVTYASHTRYALRLQASKYVLSRLTVHYSQYVGRVSANNASYEERGGLRKRESTSEKRVQRAGEECREQIKEKEAAIATHIRSRQFASSHSIREQFCQWLYILSPYRFVDFTSTTAALYIDKHIYIQNMYCWWKQHSEVIYIETLNGDIDIVASKIIGVS